MPEKKQEKEAALSSQRYWSMSCGRKRGLLNVWRTTCYPLASRASQKVVAGCLLDHVFVWRAAQSSQLLSPPCSAREKDRSLALTTMHALQLGILESKSKVLMSAYLRMVTG